MTNEYCLNTGHEIGSLDWFSAAICNCLNCAKHGSLYWRYENAKPSNPPVKKTNKP